MSTNDCEQLSLIDPDSIAEIEKETINNMPYDVTVTMKDYLSETIREQEDTYVQEFTKIMLEKIPHLKNSNYISSPDSDTKTTLTFRPPTSPKNYSKTSLDSLEYSVSDLDIGDGNFDYIKDKWERIMLENAWQAITQTNTWDFVRQDIESFMFSSDPRVDIISQKMEELGYNGHSGCSFGYTMRNMQWLAKNGIDKFKEKFVESDPELEPYPYEDAMEYEQRLKQVIKRRVEKAKREKELMEYMGSY